MKAELEQLIALQNTDTSIRRLQAEIEAIPRRRAEIEKEFDQRAFEIRELEKQRDDARTERAQLENETLEQRTKQERAERNLMSSKKQDEYTAAIREADAARKHISQLETQILEKMETFEQAEKQLKEREPETARLQSEMAERLKEFEKQARAQQEQLESSRRERERLVATLPKQMSALYRPPLASEFANSGTSKAPGTSTTSICSSRAPHCRNARKAPWRSRSVTALLNREMTMPKWRSLAPSWPL